jgi:hypothetical protein
MIVDLFQERSACESGRRRRLAGCGAMHMKHAKQNRARDPIAHRRR